MRAVLTMVGTRGDVQPMVALAVALLRRGHEAVLCAPAAFEELARAEGVEFVRFGVDPQRMLEAEKSLKALKAVFEEDAAQQFADLPRVVANADVVLGGSVVLAASAVAEKLGKRYVSAAFVPQALPSGDHPFPAFTAFGLPRWVNRLTWWAGTRVYGRMVLPLVNRHRAALGLPPERDVVRQMFGEAVLVAADEALSPAPGDAGVQVVQTGAWQLPGCALPPDVEAFLGAGRPPVYVGFGSNRDEDPDATARLVAAAVERAKVRAIVAGRARTSVGPDVLFVEDVPHDLLFPRCAAVIHHGGAGTTHAAASAGKPQGVIPHRGDQHFWAHRVRELGLGVEGFPLPRRKLTVERLAAALVSAPSDAALAARCAAFAATMRTDGLERSVAWLEAPPYPK